MQQSIAAGAANTLFTAAADLERNETTQLVEEAEVSGGGHASQRPPVPQAPSPGGSGESEPIPPPRAPGPRLAPAWSRYSKKPESCKGRG